MTINRGAAVRKANVEAFMFIEKAPDAGRKGVIRAYARPASSYRPFNHVR